MSENDSIVQKVSFQADGLRLQGYLHQPAADRPPVVIGSHGLHSSSSSPKQIALAEACNRLGIAFFRFDHRGCGTSDGKKEDVTSLEARCRDLITAATFLNDRPDIGDRLGLFGSSMGGTVCLSVAGKLGPKAMVTFAAPIRSRLPETGTESTLPSNEGGIYFDVARRRFDITDRLAETACILIFHGDADDVVPVSHAGEIYRLAQKPKKKIIQKHGDHPMSNPEHQKVFIREASLWFKRHLRATPHIGHAAG
jgi:alpha-beta hydrolase superfamily lysophospholipase